MKQAPPKQVPPKERPDFVATDIQAKRAMLEEQLTAINNKQETGACGKCLSSGTGLTINIHVRVCNFVIDFVLTETKTKHAGEVTGAKLCSIV